ncbi:biotin--[acetyl-CoA-carboxylase] ligase [Sedimentibacter sp. MB31-C6]|uniref:biotin--[acetyl-CoA-carboxylase] ligase n=1 Tax=Sedimentibacter sp. MB31-C6 TaxID=3109366 RepID=UPI002DDD34FA|nr:biotin--[acetyl-CoA-carboxylase] ligase [Sedimentibacter sp. MB36-C1]WSI04468.1 biotin--[acetyl-CoA-carboxylase] ligase [Sedimentibacter sp. MB36-C1]
MTVKNEVLHILEENKGKNISGQELANILCVSRTAIWKAIKSLQQEGYLINAASNKGYSLSYTSDVISSEGIRLFLCEKFKNIPISVYKSLSSTNTEAKAEIIQKGIHGTVVISEEQTNGRGRFGRKFFSPPNTGIYMSIILKPNLNISNSVLITTAAAVAVCLAIDKFTEKKPQIKWVNDIYIENKKICGILTEAVTDFESGTIDSIVIGIGLNVKTENKTFPNELQEIAGSILQDNDNFAIRNKLTAEIINNVLSTCEKLEEKKFLKIYKERSMILGENIFYKKNNKWIEGYAQDIDENGGLIVSQNDGQQIILKSGEVSIRKTK